MSSVPPVAEAVAPAALGQPILSPAPAPAGFAQALPTLIALSLAMAIGFTMMGSFSTIQEAAKAEMGLSDYVLSLVQGMSAAVPMVLLSVPIGILVDRTHRLRMMILLGIVWTIGTALTAFATTAPLLFFARMLAAIGTTGALTAALSLAADLVVPAHRGRAALLVTLGKTLGAAAGFALAGWLVGYFVTNQSAAFFGLSPWRSTHIALALLSAALLVPLFFLREPARHERASTTKLPLSHVSRELWKRRAFLLPLFAGQVGVVMADAAAGIWAAPVLAREHGLTPDQFAGWMGLLVLLTGIAGAVLGGIASDLGQRSGRRGGILIGAVAAAVIGVPAALFPIIPNLVGFAAAFGVLLLSGTVTGLVMSVALTVLLPNELRGLCIGAFIAVAGLVGFGAAPTLVAAVSDLMGGENQLAPALALVGTIVSAISVVAFYQAMRHAPLSATEKPV